MNKKVRLIIIIIVIISTIFLVIMFKGRNKMKPSNDKIQMISYEVISDVEKLDKDSQTKIEKLRGKTGAFVLEYGEETIVMISKGRITQETNKIEVNDISKNIDKGQYIINVQEINVGEIATEDRYLYQIIKVKENMNKDTLTFLNIGNSVVRVVDSDKVLTKK